MTKDELKEMRHIAQDLILDSIATTMYRLEKLDRTEEQIKTIKKEIVRQADRVAKMFGYESAWFN